MSILRWVPIQAAADTEMSKRVTNGVSCWVSDGEICNTQHAMEPVEVTGIKYLAFMLSEENR